MAEGSWEDAAAEDSKTGGELNPTAKPFTFNPSASGWTPGGGAAAAAPAAGEAKEAPAADAAPAVEPASTDAPADAEGKGDEGAADASAADDGGKADDGDDAAGGADGGVDGAGPEEKAAEGAAGGAGGDDGEPEEAVEAPKAAEVVDEYDPRDHLNVVFIGHVDAGKSTLSGNILYLTGMVDRRTIEKFEREAKQRNRESWFLAFIMDTNEEERAKGKTVEVGRAHFETPKKRFTVLDAPGHKNYVPNMIQGAAQADAGVLVISARKGEFETGFEGGGQTREHTMLAKTLGVRQLVVVINKMDDPTVEWSQARYDEIVGKLSPFLKASGYNLKKFVHFLPISGLSGANVKDPVGAAAPWWKGPTLLQQLDELPVGGRDKDAPLRMPVLDKYMDRGVMALGKVEAGTLVAGESVMIEPMAVEATIDSILINEVEVRTARPGENVSVKLRGVREEDVQKGFVISSIEKPCSVVTKFEAQLMLLEVKGLFTAGYSAILHVHTCTEEVTVLKLTGEIDKKTGKPKPRKPMFVKSNAICTAILEVPQSICLERFADQQQLGRFTLRDEGRSIAIGKVIRLVEGPRGDVGGAAGGAGGDKK
eukprot:CAMPEP_0203812658 /NCGR_PEP_ID=MMETSP0115-20131106/4271_1 /ASSEMBLY_ACC=CAM_ASM_000227 /TAXON_ID=33651 /ORGANISM="Bicosoecid sp, Strain ms1" /LENGTH=595 /DNA_ID=CAMNT_0050721509 /DNA_START=32 /DNA_END=1819 /DNA_ORIENTATION=+